MRFWGIQPFLMGVSTAENPMLEPRPNPAVAAGDNT
jgi:propionyl-CoA carboxylase beta chain